MKHRPTIVDVARATSLSISTVSLVLNGKSNVSDETRRKVKQAIRSLGYHPLRSARGLASKASGNIGFILSDDHFSQSEPFYTRIFLGSEFEARKHNYYLLLTTVPRRFKTNGTVPRFLLEENVDGVIIAGKINPRLVEYIDRLGVPLVIVDYDLPGKTHSSVRIDNRAGASKATLHLVEQGRRAIAFIGGDPRHPSIAERFAGFKETIRNEGLVYEPLLVVTDEADTRIHNGYHATERILKRGGKPTAVFAANDAMAIGCMNYLRSVSLVVPTDVAVAGFDDIDLSSNVEPALTTIRVFKEELGKVAIQRIVEMIRSKTRNIVTVQLPVELVVRASTGPVAAKHEEPHPVVHTSEIAQIANSRTHHRN